MVQPFDYSIRSTAQGPLQALSQGMQLGQQFAQIAEAREAARLKDEERLAAEQQARDAQTAFNTAMRDNTPQAWLQYATKVPPKQLEAINPLIQQFSLQQREGLVSDALRVVSALDSGRADILISEQMQRAQAMRNAGDEAGARRAESVAQMYRDAPDFARANNYANLSSFKEGREALQRYVETTKAGVKENWEVIPQSQISDWGWEKGTQAVRNKETGEIKGVGARGTVVNLKNEGPIPADHVAERDNQGNIVGYKVIPGSPTDIKRQAEQTAGAARAEGQVQTTGIILDDIQRVVKALDEEEALSGAARFDPFKQVTGVGGKFAAQLPGSARVTTQGIIDTVKANIGFEQLAKMRAESPTGGALGNITEQELKFLQATLGSLDLDLEPKVLRQNLRRLQTIYGNIMQKAAAYPNAAKYGFAQQPAAAPTVGTVPAGGVGAPEVRIERAQPAVTAQPPAAQPATRPATAQPAARPAPAGRDIGGGFRVLD